MNRADELAAIAAALHTPRHQILPEMAAGELTPYTLAEMSGRKRADIAPTTPAMRRRQTPRIRRIGAKAKPAAPTVDREQAIRELAYGLWEADGWQHGRDVEHWLQAAAEYEIVVALEKAKAAHLARREQG